MQKIKNVLGEFLRSRELRMTMLSAMAMALVCVVAFAAEGGSGASIDVGGITSAFTSGFNNMVTNSISMISAMVPIALSLAGVLFLVKKGMSWFKSIGKG